MSVSSVHWAGGFTGDGRTFSDAIEDDIETGSTSASTPELDQKAYADHHDPETGGEKSPYQSASSSSND